MRVNELAQIKVTDGIRQGLGRISLPDCVYISWDKYVTRDSWLVSTRFSSAIFK